MAGLLGDVLPWVYSRSNALKRSLGGLLSDPIGTFEQAGGLLQDKHREQENLLAKAFSNPKRPFQVTDRDSLDRASMNLLAGPLGFAPAGMTAWHGSPHTFDRFDSSKIGTGEGAQAYGHGLYLAEKPEVAKQYADTLSDVQKLTPEGRAAKALAEANGSVIDAKRALYRQYNESAGTPYADAAWNAVQALERGGVKAPNLYKVDLPDDAVARMLDWDKPLSQQPENVRKPLEALIAKARAKAEVSGVRPQYWPPNVQQAQEMSGEMLQKHLADTFPSIGMGRFETAAQQAGIPGIRYLDGGSRGAGAGSSNFVVFPGEENLLKILERNGVPLK